METSFSYCNSAQCEKGVALLLIAEDGNMTSLSINVIVSFPSHS